jgi:hypothetical protein
MVAPPSIAIAATSLQCLPPVASRIAANVAPALQAGALGAGCAFNAIMPAAIDAANHRHTSERI